MIPSVPVPSLPPSTPAILKRYDAALNRLHEPKVLTFDYTLEQTGMRTLAQTHRVFRSGFDERDETLTVDGKRLSPPKVRIFRGRRNRYSIGALAPRLADYRFALTGLRHNGHHTDYVFRLTPLRLLNFTITDLTIDGVRFLPSSLNFATRTNDGTGTVSFARYAAWWIPYGASARATVSRAVAAERLSFYTYRFPATLPASTFSQARRPAPLAPTGVQPVTQPRATPLPPPGAASAQAPPARP